MHARKPTPARQEFAWAATLSCVLAINATTPVLAIKQREPVQTQ
jgi:hypothetical protein